MATTTPIIGSIVERKIGTNPKEPKATFGSNPAGFPTVQHRSKSAFSRNREEVLRRNANNSFRSAAPPTLATRNTATGFNLEPLSIPPPTRPAPTKDDPEKLREQISRENDALLAGMSPDEIEDERRQILERFGAGISGVLEKAKRNRMKRVSDVGPSKHSNGVVPPSVNVQETIHDELSEIPISPEERKPFERSLSPPPPALSAGSTRPSSRADQNRKLRFAELDPKDVFVYESTPPSPRRPVLALPPPSGEPDTSVVSLGQWQGSIATEPVEKPAPEEGTPEDIRRRYFPNVVADNPNIEWMTTKSSNTPEDNSIRFDLHGAPIPANLTATLPIHLGLHHHSEGSRAGYTLDDIFLLSRSTVPAQRSAMFGVLSGISQRLARVAHGEVVDGLEELRGKEEALRKRIASAGVEAMNERGNVGLQAIDVVWRSIVDWDRDLVSIGLEGIQLESSADETMHSLSLDFILPSLVTIYNVHSEAYPPETLKQLLEVTQRLALQNADFATRIVKSADLLTGIVRHFILPPSTTEGSLPDPSAITLLTYLAKSSRRSAEIISRNFADGLLRYIISLPPSSPLPSTLSISLITSTLELYGALATYGLFTHVASTAMEQFTNLGHYISTAQSENPSLVASWLKLIQVWTICAIDPHATSPPHDILWSRVSAWGWHTDVLQIAGALGTDYPEQWNLWGEVFGALAAWLEGSKVNGVKGGESERNEMLEKIRSGFSGGQGRTSQVLNTIIEYLQKGLESPDASSYAETNLRAIATAMRTTSNVLRLWLASLPPHLEGPPPSPPFDLPYGRISRLAATVLSHPIWAIATSTIESKQSRAQHYSVVHLREFASFLAWYIRLSRRLPDTSQSLWLAQAFSVLLRFMPGDEDIASNTISLVLQLVPEIASNPAALEPFLAETILPREEEQDGDSEDMEVVKPRWRLSPLVSTPQSIIYSTSSIMISPFAGPSMKQISSGLPLQINWMLTPLNHLLHSGDSAVFKHLPGNWGFSELDVTRASMVLALKGRQVLLDWKLPQFAMRRGDAILACMEVFMLEHGLVQDKSGTSADEVFRDKVVEGLMSKLLDPYRLGATGGHAEVERADDLEALATSFLGPSTPFYQFFTDFVALYDAISFSHPLFGQLLLPPLSMRYAFDYRRLFWCDYAHILKTINIYPHQVLSADLREFLYPVESDAQVIGGYLGALVKGHAKEFLRWIAVHHVATNIWEDLRDEDVDGFNEERAVKLLQAVIGQGDVSLVPDVVKYSPPPRTESLRIRPDCFQVDPGVLAVRKQWIERAVGGGYTKRLEEIL